MIKVDDDAAHLGANRQIPLRVFVARSRRVRRRAKMVGAMREEDKICAARRALRLFGVRLNPRVAHRLKTLVIDRQSASQIVRAQ